MASRMLTNQFLLSCQQDHNLSGLGVLLLLSSLPEAVLLRDILATSTSTVQLVQVLAGAFVPAEQAMRWQGITAHQYHLLAVVMCFCLLCSRLLSMVDRGLYSFPPSALTCFISSSSSRSLSCQA